MAGGIQLGMVATDKESAKMDFQCKSNVERVFSYFKDSYPKLSYSIKLQQNQIPGGAGACAPDGALWFYDGILIAAFEGKKQQDRGNAIERWYKNNFICRLINPQVSYVTFACGDGAHKTGTIGKCLSVSHLSGFNKYNPGENSCFMEISGFDDDFVFNTMIEVIQERINYYSNVEK